MVIILGQGSWGKRLKTEFEKEGRLVRAWTHHEEPFEIGRVDRVVVAIPSPYLLETLEKFKVDASNEVYSATKGLDVLGRLPSVAIREVWGTSSIQVIGGACISTEPILNIIYGQSGDAFEISGVLKNVYAIGFNIQRTLLGDNAAAAWFTSVWEELRGIGAESRYLSDLVVTCMSERSRNSKVGKLIAQGKQIDLGGQVAEGIHTACVIKKYDLFAHLTILREVVEAILKGDYDLHRYAG